MVFFAGFGLLDLDLLVYFADLVRSLLAHPLRLETVLYKFYKNWEEHQRRHWRGEEPKTRYVQR